MRNMLLAFAALAMLGLAGNAMAVELESDVSSVLVSSASDIPAADLTDHATSSQTMVGTSADAPTASETIVVESTPEVVHYHQGYHPQNCCCAPVCKEPSLFDKLMELERKKNAWLLKTFLGR